MSYTFDLAIVQLRLIMSRTGGQLFTKCVSYGSKAVSPRSLQPCAGTQISKAVQIFTLLCHNVAI